MDGMAFAVPSFFYCLFVLFRSARAGEGVSRAVVNSQSFPSDRRGGEGEMARLQADGSPSPPFLCGTNIFQMDVSFVFVYKIVQNRTNTRRLKCYLLFVVLCVCCSKFNTR